jgi:(R,R)-butanediol dehydrogenase/meso-butanediol dehydrogenase/diacetyl reductase/L-iditol 2-dehydrogenase
MSETTTDSASMKVGVQLGIQKYGVAEMPKPKATPGMVVAKVSLAGVCGSDLHRYWHRRETQTAPDGHEMVGVVTEVGDGVTNVHPGDRVVADLITLGRGCGVCYYCRTGNHTHCIDPNRPRISGAFSEYIHAKAAGFFRLPDNVDDRAAVLIEPLAVGVHGVRWSGMPPGSTVAVVGAGTIGLATMLAAKAAGASRVFITAKHPFQAAAARRLGATEVLPIDPVAADAVIKEATNGLGADCVFETVGGGADTFDLACQLARPLGKVTILGVYFERSVTVDLFHPLLKEVTIYLPDCYSIIDGRHDFELAVDMSTKYAQELRSLVTHEFTLDEVEKAFHTAADKRTGSIKVLVRPG